MKKFINVQTGNEVKIGDKVDVTAAVTLPELGKVKVTKEITVTKESLNFLIKKGKVKVVGGESLEHLKNTILGNLVAKTGWKAEKLFNIFNILGEVNQWAVIQIFLREIAIELDKKYEDHINMSEHIYAISPQDGKIHEINKATIKSYKAFPAFRTIEDAKTAYEFLKDYLKSLFAND